MNESTIHISFVKREAIGTNKPDDFLAELHAHARRARGRSPIAK